MSDFPQAEILQYVRTSLGETVLTVELQNNQIELAFNEAFEYLSLFNPIDEIASLIVKWQTLANASRALAIIRSKFDTIPFSNTTGFAYSTTLTVKTLFEYAGLLENKVGALLSLTSKQ